MVDVLDLDKKWREDFEQLLEGFQPLTSIEEERLEVFLTDLPSISSSEEDTCFVDQVMARIFG